MIVTILIPKSQVTDTLMRTTGYIGARQPGSEPGTYERLTLNQGDMALIERFWQESRESLCMALRRQIEAEGDEGEDYRIDLRLSDSFDTSLTATLQSGIMSYFMLSMAAKWLAITDSDRASEYATESAAALGEVTRKAYCKIRPKRPTYNNR